MPTAQVNGTNLYYELSGSGPDVLLLHGLGSSTVDWTPQVAALASRYRVCVVDLRGHGRSAKPKGPYSISLFAEDTAALIRDLSLAPAHVVGISMGGMIAFELALAFPQLVRSLVIVNSGPGLPGGRLTQSLFAAHRLLMVRVLGLRKFGQQLADRLLPDASAEERQAFADRWGANDARAYRAAVKSIVGWNVSERLEAVTPPVLIVAADGDYTPLSYKQAYVARLPRAELVVIDNARHAVTMERPQQFNTVLLRFLDSLQA
jgi:pimeloyl-ACP methyl ester carboxylesterase